MTQKGDEDSKKGVAWWENTEGQKPSAERPRSSSLPTAPSRWSEEQTPALFDINQPPKQWSAETRDAFRKWLQDESPEAIRRHSNVALQLVLGEPRSREETFAVSVLAQAFRERFFRRQSRALMSSGTKVSRILEKLQASGKFDKSGPDTLRSTEEPPTSEGNIQQNIPTQDLELSQPSLPEKPQRYWPGRRRGRPALDEGQTLISFLEEVYGSYLPAAKNDLRDYIFENDPKLYAAIRDFERKNALPAHLQMPTRDEKYLARLLAAEAVNFTGMSDREREHAKERLSAFREGRSQRLKLNPH